MNRACDSPILILRSGWYQEAQGLWKCSGRAQVPLVKFRRFDGEHGDMEHSIERGALCGYLERGKAGSGRWYFSHCMSDNPESSKRLQRYLRFCVQAFECYEV
jgi:hypothetical protein